MSEQVAQAETSNTEQVIAAEAKSTANQEASVPSKTSETANTQAASPANTPAANPEDNLPFHKHPKFTEALKTAKESQKRYEALEREFKEQKAYLDGLRNGQPKAESKTISPEQRQAAIELASLLKEVPEFASALGLDKIPSLAKDTEDFKMARAEEAFNKELGDVLTQAESMGLPKDEVEARIQELMQDPLYSEKSYRPGLVKSMFRDAYFDQMGEIAKREANKALIKEQEEKRKGNSETTGSTGKVASKALEPSLEMFLARRMAEEGWDKPVATH